MKTHPLAIVLGCTIATAAHAADNQEATVRFSNNDKLVGSVHSLTADQLVLKSPSLDQPTAFFLSSVMDLSLPSSQPEHAAEHEATLKLTNGDTVCGQLASVTDEAVALDTWYAGRMNFNRLMVSGLKISGKSNFIYRGPNGLEGWIQSNDRSAWTFSRSALRVNSTGSIARPDLLPEQCSVSFDLAWKGDNVGLKVIIFSDEPAAANVSSGYELSFQRGSIYLRNCRTQSFLGSTSSPVLMESDRVHIELRASSTSGKVCLFLNDKPIEIWTDPDVGKGKFGSALHFVSQIAVPMRISNIGVAKWDGTVDRIPEPRVGMLRQFGMPVNPQDEDAKTATEKPKEGRMELANGDSIEGEVASIQDGVIAVKTPLGDVKIPVSRLRTVALKKVDLERCKRRNGDIRAWFADGSSIVFKLESVGNDTLTGSSQNFGTATFKTNAFNRLEFNIYDPELDEKRGPGDW